jgi:hypothetical protein
MLKLNVELIEIANFPNWEIWGGTFRTPAKSADDPSKLAETIIVSITSGHDAIPAMY